MNNLKNDPDWLRDQDKAYLAPSDEEVSKATEDAQKSIENQKDVTAKKKESETTVDTLKGELMTEESKETVTKSLEFENDTFKIDSTWWKEEERGAYPNWAIKVKVNATWDVVEYLGSQAKWEQIFITYDAFIREVMKAKNCSKEDVEKKYIMTVDEIKEKMKDKPNKSDEYKEFFNEEIKDYVAGFWSPSSDFCLGGSFSMWLAGGSSAAFSQYGCDLYADSKNYGLSGRLLKN